MRGHSKTGATAAVRPKASPQGLAGPSPQPRVRPLQSCEGRVSLRSAPASVQEYAIGGPERQQYRNHTLAVINRPVAMRFDAIPLLTTLLFVAGCGGGTQRAAPPSDEPPRLACDRLAARAIQVASPDEAADLAGRAASCYETLDIPAL